MYKEAFYKMAADDDNSLLKGLSIGAGSLAGLGGLVFANKKFELLGKLVNKFKKPELKGIQLLGKPFVKSDFKPGSPVWKDAKKYYKDWSQNLQLYGDARNNAYIGSIYKTLVPEGKGYITDLKRGNSLLDNFNSAVKNQLQRIQHSLGDKNINKRIVSGDTYNPTRYFNQNGLIKTPKGELIWKIKNPHDRPQQKLNKEDRSLLAALIGFSKNKNPYGRSKYGVNLSLQQTSPQPLNLWEKLIQNKPLQLGPYWQYLDGKISRIPQQ